MTATLRNTPKDRSASSASVIAPQAIHRIPPRARIEATAPMERRFLVDLVDGGIEVEVINDEPDWLYQVLATVQDLSFLPEGWDSYGGLSLTHGAALGALKLMARLLPPNAIAPSLVPGSNGGVQLEWHRNSGDLEILIDPSGELSAVYANTMNGEWETDITPIDLAQLRLTIEAIAMPV